MGACDGGTRSYVSRRHGEEQGTLFFAARGERYPVGSEYVYALVVEGQRKPLTTVTAADPAFAMFAAQLLADTERHEVVHVWWLDPETADRSYVGTGYWPSRV